MLLLAPLGKNSKTYEKCVLQAIKMIILQQKLSSSFVFVELAAYIHRPGHGFVWFYYQAGEAGARFLLFLLTRKESLFLWASLEEQDSKACKTSRVPL